MEFDLRTYEKYCVSSVCFYESELTILNARLLYGLLSK
jgi:hypothetical protein